MSASKFYTFLFGAFQRKITRIALKRSDMRNKLIRVATSLCLTFPCFSRLVLFLLIHLFVPREQYWSKWKSLHCVYCILEISETEFEKNSFNFNETRCNDEVFFRPDEPFKWLLLDIYFSPHMHFLTKQLWLIVTIRRDCFFTVCVRS